MDLSTLMPAPAPNVFGEGLQTVAGGIAMGAVGAALPDPADLAISAATYGGLGAAACFVLGGRFGYGLAAGLVGGFGAEVATGSSAAGMAGAAGLAALAAVVYPGRRR